MFFLNEDTAERAKQAFQTLVEAEYEALGGAINNDAQEDDDAEAGDEGSTSILQSLRKRICRDRDRERQIQVNIYSSFLLLRGEGGCVCVRVFFTHPLVIRSGSFFSMTFFT